MNTNTPEREQRLNQILLAYIEAQQAGQVPALGQLLLNYPEFADELIEFTAGRKQLDRLAGCLRSDSGTAGQQRSGVAGADIWALPGNAERGVIGDFRLLREVGRGGMGIVYEAEQLSLQRRVALKVLPFAAAFDPKQLQRFKHESLAAAHLHHTNIVPVYAVGTDRGYHYYAMQFIDGQSLAAVLLDLRRQSQPAVRSQESQAPATVVFKPAGPAVDTMVAPPMGSLTTKRSTNRRSFFNHVAELGLKAAEALEHAHQLGVIHRDIKPANLLLDVRGHLWITDFGLALFQDQGGLTVTGELLGTLRYMSPEQAAGRRTVIDHRTDIYSLGATLYELLTLQPVVDGEDRHELLTRLALCQPRLPRAIDPAIPVELETIVLKALAEQPCDRYASAQDFAADLRRFLEDRPILAKRPSLLDQARKWGRRNKSVVVSAVVLLFLATVGLLVSTCLIANAYEREHQEAAEARKNFQHAEQQRARAEKSFNQARKAVEFFTKVSKDELAYHPFMQGVRRRMLLVALDHFQEFIEDWSDDPGLQKELAVSRAEVRTLLGQLSTLYSGRFNLLTEPAVQHDLKLSEAQKEQVKESINFQVKKLYKPPSPEDFKAGPKPRPLPEHDKRFQDMAHASEQEVARILTVPQVKRLNQILLQVQLRGPDAFTDLSVVEALELTAAQMQKLRDQQDKGSREVTGMFLQRVPLDKIHRDAETLWLGIHEHFLAGLTAAQRSRWQGLVGQLFRGTIRNPAIVFGGHFHFPGMGGPGGPKDRKPFPEKKGPPWD